MSNDPTNQFQHRHVNQLIEDAHEGQRKARRARIVAIIALVLAALGILTSIYGMAGVSEAEAKDEKIEQLRGLVDDYQDQVGQCTDAINAAVKVIDIRGETIDEMVQATASLSVGDDDGAVSTLEGVQELVSEDEEAYVSFTDSLDGC